MYAVFFYFFCKTKLNDWFANICIYISALFYKEISHENVYNNNSCAQKSQYSLSYTHSFTNVIVIYIFLPSNIMGLYKEKHVFHANYYHIVNIKEINDCLKFHLVSTRTFRMVMNIFWMYLNNRIVKVQSII